METKRLDDLDLAKQLQNDCIPLPIILQPLYPHDSFDRVPQCNLKLRRYQENGYSATPLMPN